MIDLEQFKQLYPNRYAQLVAHAQSTPLASKTVTTALSNFIKPELCALYAEPFTDPNYLWEIKYDGERCIADVRKDDHSLQARSGRDKTKMFPELHLETQVPAILDGEMVCYQDGKLIFNALQHRTNLQYGVEQAVKLYPVTYEVFDILQADGQDLQNLSLAERKKILAQTLIVTDNVRIVPTFTDGVALFEKMVADHIEGVVGKALISKYHQGKRNWIKVKATQIGEFIVSGYTPGTGWRASTFGALILKDENGKYVGNVGTGFDENEIRRLYEKLKSNQHIKVRVQYLEKTDDGMLRFPSYKGEA